MWSSASGWSPLYFKVGIRSYVVRRNDLILSVQICIFILLSLCLLLSGMTINLCVLNLPCCFIQLYMNTDDWC